MISPAQIGKCGELLVQLRFLKCGVESAHLTTDSGIDLVAYSGKTGKPLTIQVKTNLKAKPAGGTSHLAWDWWVPQKCVADLIALVDLETEQVWILTMAEIKQTAQQSSAKGFHVCWYVTHLPADHAKTRPASEFEQFLLGNRVNNLF